jgi:hypothetical protein
MCAGCWTAGKKRQVFEITFYQFAKVRMVVLAGKEFEI